MKRILPIVLALPLTFCLWIVATNTASADTIIYGDAVPETPLPLSDSLVFPKFDPDVGILTSVDISVTSSLSGSLGYENLLDQPIDVSIKVTGFQELMLLSGSIVNTDVPLVTVNKSLAPFEADTVPFSEQILSEISLSDSSSLSAFEGSGDVELPVTASAVWDASGGNPNIQITLISSGDAVGRFQYNFVIPEVTLQKLTNGFDADDPNGLDVPEIAPGDPVTWTYIVTNTGTISIPQTSIVVTDSHSTVLPVFVIDSDDGDGLLAPDEGWFYQASALAAELLDPSETTDLTIVDGCGEQGASIFGERATYENVGTVRIPGFSTSDPSHYCNPAEPGIVIEKATNGVDADLPSDPTVPVIVPGQSVLWTYVVSNTGNVTFTEAQVDVSDNIAGVNPVLNSDSDDGDSLLSPSESWTFAALGAAADLTDPGQTAGMIIVPGCRSTEPDESDPLPTYQNRGSVVVPGATDADDSHYCNPAVPTSIALVRFAASPQTESIDVFWEVALELNTAGYHLLRSEGGRDEAVRVNETLIPALGTGIGADGPRRYSYLDETVTAGVVYGYWLQDVAVSGAITEYGPLYSSVQSGQLNHRVFMPMIVD